MKKLLLLLAVLLIAVVPAFAGDQLTLTGFNISSDGQTAYRSLIEEITTSDTVTASESGKVFVITPADTKQVKMTLPTAAAGLTYTFYAADGGTAAAVNKYVIVDPASTDTFVGCVNSASATTFATGDALKNAGATGDTVTLVGNTLYWYCTSRTGVWSDNNSLNN